jgi:hypothetical protein
MTYQQLRSVLNLCLHLQDRIDGAIELVETIRYRLFIIISLPLHQIVNVQLHVCVITSFAVGNFQALVFKVFL